MRYSELITRNTKLENYIVPESTNNCQDSESNQQQHVDQKHQSWRPGCLTTPLRYAKKHEDTNKSTWTLCTVCKCLGKVICLAIPASGTHLIKLIRWKYLLEIGNWIYYFFHTSFVAMLGIKKNKQKQITTWYN